jgi:hypothetical protein
MNEDKPPESSPAKRVPRMAEEIPSKYPVHASFSRDHFVRTKDLCRRRNLACTDTSSERVTGTK